MTHTHSYVLEGQTFGDVSIRKDPFNPLPTVLSRRRAEKVGKEPQAPMADPKGPTQCIACCPELKSIGSPHVAAIADRVGGFRNDAPYLAADQWVLFLHHPSPEFCRSQLHRVRLAEVGRRELFWLTQAVRSLGRRFKPPRTVAAPLRQVAGMNLGKLAGQSLPHVHMQCGWEALFGLPCPTPAVLRMYLEDLAERELIFFRSKPLLLAAPWAPRGSYAVDVHFPGKYEFGDLVEADLRTFAVVGERLFKCYVALGIQNVNVVFSNSPRGRELDPLIAHFVPRVNIPAIYELHGVNVVDTPPETTAERLRDAGRLLGDGLSWAEFARAECGFDPDQVFEACCALA
jgi:galactose-1-phosphate uridylyltransferase